MQTGKIFTSSNFLVQKRGQTIFGITYGMIFSIIVIIAIIAVGFYSISYFLGLNKCTQAGLFFNNLQKEIDSAWTTSGKYSKVYTGKIPPTGTLRTQLKNVCFGNLTADAPPGEDSAKKIELEDYYMESKANLFLYHPDNACEGFSTFNLKHMKIDMNSYGFFCTRINDGEIKLKIEKESNEALVRLSDFST